MSVANQGTPPQVSDHAQWRFMQRGDGAATRYDVQSAWQAGHPVNVPSKSYQEARYTIVGGTELVLLKQGTHIATVVCAPQEAVSFVGTPPELECSCGAHRRKRHLGKCPVCGGRSWSISEVSQ